MVRVWVSNFFAKLGSLYVKYPVFMNSSTGFITFSGGDLLSQCYTGKNVTIQTIKVERAVTTGMLGIALNGASLYGWYHVLDKVLGASGNYKTVALKCLADQIVYAPFSIIAFFSYAAMIKVNGDTFLEQVQDRIQKSFMIVWLADCCVWPLVNFVGFRYVHINIRPTFISVAQLFWQIYLSAVSFKDVPSHHHHSHVPSETTPGKLPMEQETGHDDGKKHAEERSEKN
jgi:protein Mpv17